jgi:hypothetical protein
MNWGFKGWGFAGGAFFSLLISVVEQPAHAEWSTRAKAEIERVSAMPPIAMRGGEHATVWGAVRAQAYALLPWKKPQNYKRVDIPVQGGMVPVSIITQTVLGMPRPAPLMVVLPGMGGDSDDASTMRLFARFKEKGFHVVSIANPWSPSYIANAPRHEPGSVELEAKVILQALRVVVRQLKIQGPIAITGRSYGGLLAAAVYAVQKEEGLIRGAVTIMGPPLRLDLGIARFDEMFQDAWDLEDRRVCDLSFLRKLMLGVTTAIYEENRELPLGRAECASALITDGFHSGLQRAAHAINLRDRSARRVPARLSMSEFTRDYSPTNYAKIGFSDEGNLSHWICSISPDARRRLRILAAVDDFLTAGLRPSFQDTLAEGCPDGTRFADAVFLPWGGHLGFEGLDWFRAFTRRFLNEL